MSNIDERVIYLEEAGEALRMQNRVLATALKGLLHALPPDVAETAITDIRAAFEDELAQLQYDNEAQADLFHDATYAFFAEREH